MNVGCWSFTSLPAWWQQGRWFSSCWAQPTAKPGTGRNRRESPSMPSTISPTHFRLRVIRRLFRRSPDIPVGATAVPMRRRQEERARGKGGGFPEFVEQFSCEIPDVVKNVFECTVNSTQVGLWPYSDWFLPAIWTVVIESHLRGDHSIWEWRPKFKDIFGHF